MIEEFRLVFSSEKGRMCPECGFPKAACRCDRKRRLPAGDGMARVRRETKGRKGKTVTTISGLNMDDETMKRLAGELKKRCGAGGAVKNGVIEIQGDHRDEVMAELARRNIEARRAGG
ncbi:translation initiation factor Sui1 [bacterium]|nr:translation initiation factor Sui1 [candidate division CSSED10-310 bacterium]